MNNKKLFLYINNIYNLPSDTEYENITNIDHYTDNSINHIIINDLLDYYDYNTEYNLLQLICSKLHHGGQIEIQAPDLNELCITVASNKINDDLVKNILYKNKKSIHTIYDIENMLNNLGLIIL